MLLPLLAATSLLPLTVLAHSPHSAPHSHANSRKTLSFGPAHPHAKFHTHHGHHKHHARSSVAARDPVDAAKAWLNETQKAGGWYIRDDSYTDKNTRITHVYARQLVNGLEVVDGDMNINVDQDGNVVSSGSSFYTGAIPELSSDVPSTESSPHCASLKETLTTATKEFRSLLSSLSFEQASEHLVQYGHDQVTFGAGSAPAEVVEDTAADVDHDALDRISQTVKELHRTAQAMCPLSTIAKSALTETIHALSSHASSGAAPALLAFIALVTPSSNLASELHANPAEYLSKITSEFEHSLLPGGIEKPVEILRGVPEAISPVKATMGYIQGEAGLQQVWRFEVEMKDNWYEGTVDFKTGRVVGAVDWARDAPSPKKGKKTASVETYNVWPFGVNDPVSGKRSILEAPFDEIASPYGWHSYPGSPDPFTSATPGVTAKSGWVNTTTTIGNNVFAQENWEGQGNYVRNLRPQANSSLVFDFEYGAEEGLRPKEYVDLAVTELFYTCNMFHDLTYRLGFDELAGNFQQSNYGKGGKGDDAVIANAQDGSGTNNANFATPPDGQHGKMRMYVWDTATPYRDGDLEAGIVVHEYAHGLSTRLTGGPANSGCLGWGEAGGMGEGWGDFLATQIRKPSSKYSDYPMGSWAANREGGIRNYPYSTNETVNPSTYKTLDKSGYFGVHAIGEVWAEFLFVMTESLIAKHGFSKTLFPPTNTSIANEYYTEVAEFNTAGELVKPLIPKHGNTLAVQLVINGMKLQPCRPSFFDARDAIVQADKILTGGENACEIWTAFTERGLGPEAALRGATPWGGGIRVEDYSLPKGVCKKTKKVASA